MSLEVRDCHFKIQEIKHVSWLFFFFYYNQTFVVKWQLSNVAGDFIILNLFLNSHKPVFFLFTSKYKEKKYFVNRP